jgi:hypothetical protein
MPQMTDMQPHHHPRQSPRKSKLRVAFVAAALLTFVLAALHPWRDPGTKSAPKDASSPANSAVPLHNRTARSPFPARPIYPFSVIPGGAYDATELRNRLRSDEVAARHYQLFHLARLTTVKASSALFVYVSYRKGDSIYWTRKPVRLTKGETLLTDGVLLARARCGNRISATPMHPIGLMDPPPDILEIPKSWQPPGAALSTPPDEPVAERSRTIPGSPLGPGPEVAPKHPKLVLFPIPIIPIGGGGRKGGSPGTGSPGGDKPGGSVPPGTGGPGGGNPGSSNPPGTGGPGGGNPGGSNPPGTGNPGGGNPGSSNPPGTGGPGGGNPGGSNPPGTGHPGGGNPGGSNPPGTGNPGGGLGPIEPPPPPPVVEPVPEPNLFPLLLTALLATAGAHWWRRRSSKSR